MQHAVQGPSFERYVAGLAGGLDAFPHARVKGSCVRSVLEGQPEALVRSLPEPVRALAVEPPVDSDWVPQVHLAALVHALAERRGLGEREFLAWARARNRALYASALYRMLMAVESPEAMLRHAPRRWGNFHRGTTLDHQGYSDDGARFTLRFPAAVFDPLLLRGYAEAFAAALEAARAHEPLVEIEAIGPGFARYRTRW